MGKQRDLSLETYIEKTTTNIEEDRAMAKSLLIDVMTDMKASTADRREMGPIAAKYVENLQRSNEQLVKLAAILQKQYAYEDLSLDFDTFFYSGGSTHLRDLKLLGNAFDNETFFAKTPKLPKRMKGTKVQLSDIQEYAKDYEDCGICVIPLQDNLFNNCKSELKMIEAGHFAKPVMVSAVEPYTLLSTNKNSLKVYNNEWAAAIKKIKGNHTMQVDLGLKLKEDITIKHDLSKENEKRLQSL